MPVGKIELGRQKLDFSIGIRLIVIKKQKWIENLTLLKKI